MRGVRATLVAQLLVSLFCAGSLAACTLDVSGLADVGADALVMADDSGGDALDASAEASPDSSDASNRGDAGDGTVETGTDACGPASLGYACVASAPEGWSQAVFDPTGQASCPKQFPQPIFVDVDTRAPSAQCSCSCTVVTQPTCDKTAVSVLSGTTASCMPGSMAVTADGTCMPMPRASVPAYVNLVAPTPMGTFCSPSTVVQLPSSSGSKGQLCMGGAPLAGGCRVGQVCVAAPSPLQSCIEQIGQHECPPGYVSHFVGSAHDTRGCGAGCSCTQAATCSATLTYFNDDTCNITNVALTTGGGCTLSNASQQAGSYVANLSAQNVACNPAGTPLPVGQVLLDQARTICCN